MSGVLKNFATYLTIYEKKDLFERQPDPIKPMESKSSSYATFLD